MKGWKYLGKHQFFKGWHKFRVYINKNGDIRLYL